MPIKITNATVDNQGGTFMKIVGEFDVDINGLDIKNYSVEDYRAITFDIEEKPSFMEKLGLSRETNPKELADLLIQLQGKNKDEGSEIVKKSGFLEKLTTLKDASILTTNLLTLVAQPNIAQIIAWLSS